MSDVVQPRPNPPELALHVHFEPGGGASLPRLLLIKPDRTRHEPLDGLCGHAKPLRAEMVAQEVEALLDAADEGPRCGVGVPP